MKDLLFAAIMMGIEIAIPPLVILGILLLPMIAVCGHLRTRGTLSPKAWRVVLIISGVVMSIPVGVFLIVFVSVLSSG
jgi:hypothetical protein